jgi:hypothetical protein
LTYTKLLADERATTYNWSLFRTAGWFARHGSTINLVMTNNGSRYRPHLLLIACHNLGA